MGCDIHLHQEVEIDGQWLHYGAPWVPRNYELFEKMAGVRGDDSRAIALPRGLPDDITLITRLSAERWGSDAHSHSWLAGDELFEVIRFVDDNWGMFSDMRLWFGWLNGGNWHEPKPPITKARWVFWFDN